MIKTNFSNVKTGLVGYIKDSYPDFLQNEECDAILSHFIHNPEICPPIMDNSLYLQCRNFIFTKYSINEIKNKISDGDNFLQQYFSFTEDYSSFPPPQKPQFSFIDLFAGIGGFRIALQKCGGKCVFSSEWDKYAKKTYETNFYEIPFGDITKIDKKTIPSHDILCAGFPCQAFSIAGYRKGFSDEKGRGNLFFDIYEILKLKQPKSFFLENVKNLQSHDKGNTFKVIMECLCDAGYSVVYKVLNSVAYGNVPQNRERIYIVGFRNDISRNMEFSWPDTIPLKTNVRDCLEKNVDAEFYYENSYCYKELKKYMKSKETVYQWRRMYVRENKNNVCPTLTANMGTGGHNVPLILDDNGKIRKLTPIECARLQGFPKDFVLPSNTPKSQLYKQLGNSVTVPVIYSIAKNITNQLVGKQINNEIYRKTA